MLRCIININEFFAIINYLILFLRVAKYVTFQDLPRTIIHPSVIIIWTHNNPKKPSQGLAFFTLLSRPLIVIKYLSGRYFPQGYCSLRFTVGKHTQQIYISCINKTIFITFILHLISSHHCSNDGNNTKFITIDILNETGEGLTEPKTIIEKRRAIQDGEERQ